MRDAFGGAFMIKLFLVFLFIYIFFTAMALNYAKAFKVKNKVIDYLEDNEIIDAGATAAEYKKMSDHFEKEKLGTLNYRIDNNSMPCNYNTEPNIVYCENGIKIVKMQPKATRGETNKMGTYYRVETYFTWNLSFLRKLTALSSDSPDGDVGTGYWKISGETRPIAKE